MFKRLTLMLVAIVLLGTSATVLATAEVAFVPNTTLEAGTLSSGIEFLRQDGTSYTDAGTPGSQHVSVVTADKDAAMLVPWSLLTTTGIVGGTVVDIANDFMTWHPGYRVVAAINGDYYNMTTMEPVNALAQFGRVVKPSNFYLDRYFSIGLDDNTPISNKDNETSSDTLITLYDETGRPVREFVLEGWNRMPSDQGVTAFYQLINPPVTTGAFLYKGDIVHQTNYGQRYIRTRNLATVDAVSMETHDITIAFTDPSLLAWFEEADHIEVQTPFAGVYEGMDNVIGVGSQPLVDDVIQAFEDINDQSVSFAQARHPRTSLGFTAEGDLILLTADGRQPDMDGVNLRELSAIMRHHGAVNAFNLDGGGSSQMAIDDGDGLRILNSPSDASLRRVANAILLVVPDVRVELDVIERTASDVTFQYDVTSDVDVQDITVYLDDTPYDLSSGSEHTLDGLAASTYHILTIEVSYEIDGISNTVTFARERLFPVSDDTTEPTEPTPPYEFEVTFTENSAIDGFTATITFEDPDNRFVKLYLIEGDDRYIASKIIGGYEVEFPDAIPGTTYSFLLEVHYRFGHVTPEVEVLDSVFEHTYIEETEAPTTDDGSETESLMNGVWITVASIASAGLIATGVVVFTRRPKGV
jgi:hypothetical protein